MPSLKQDYRDKGQYTVKKCPENSLDMLTLLSKDIRKLPANYCEVNYVLDQLQ